MAPRRSAQFSLSPRASFTSSIPPLRTSAVSLVAAIRFWMRFIFSRYALAFASAVRVWAAVRTTGLPLETTLGCAPP